MSSLLSDFPPIRYVSPLLDVSGYGEAARHQFLALQKHGAPVRAVVVETPLRMNPDVQIDPLQRRIRDILATQAEPTQPPSIHIYHLTPEMAAPLKQGGPDDLHICAVVWETTRLPVEWVRLLNAEFDQVWCPTAWQIDVFRQSGVKTPLALVPFGVDVVWYPREGSVLSGVRSSSMETVFYSIFQWTHRKNPEGMLFAYLAAFTAEDPVTYVIKSYADDTDATRLLTAQQVIEERVRQICEQIRHPNPPKIKVVGRHLNRDEVLALHRTCDVFVGLSRGEGWCFPAFEAQMMGNTAILTNWSAPTAFSTPETAYLVGHQLTPVTGMAWSPWYFRDQWWAEPNLLHAVLAMRQAAHARHERTTKALAAWNLVSGFSTERVAFAARDALKTILET